MRIASKFSRFQQRKKLKKRFTEKSILTLRDYLIDYAQENKYDYFLCEL